MDNADLEKLKVSAGKLLPKFKASITDYTVTLASSVAELKLTVLTSDSGASYTIKGTKGGGKEVTVEEGQILDVQIEVSAEDGTTTKTYSLKIMRLCADDARLSRLGVSTGTLQPEFSPAMHSYECNLPCGVEQLTLRAKTEDEAMKLSMMDGSEVGMVKLSPGRTICVLVVESTSGNKKMEYIVVFNKTLLPPMLQLKKLDQRFECAVCCCVIHQSTRIDGGAYAYCSSCLEELTRTNKVNPFTGAKLEEEGWKKLDFKRDDDLAGEEAVCSLSSEKVEGSMASMGAKLMAEREKLAETSEPTEACKSCSKKVPQSDVALHKELLCTAKFPIKLTKKEVGFKAWEKRLVDETIGGNADELMKEAMKCEEKYLHSLPLPGKIPQKQSPLDHLLQASRIYATAIKSSPKDSQAHLALGLVLEELFFAEDLFGLVPEVPLESEGEAQTSSKEEEFLAICKIHGVSSSAPVALQLKAVEAEYQALKESGQAHKADHVQGLYAWKSKKILEAGQGSYTADNESPLYRAKLKYQDAVSVNPSNGMACYHLGRLCLLLGDRDGAKEYLLPAVALKPTLSEARLCLGIALATQSKAHSTKLLLHGLSQYLMERQAFYETNAEPQKHTPKQLHANNFYSGSNILIAEGFLLLASFSGSGHLSVKSCLLNVTSCVARAHLQHRASTYQRLLWHSLKARATLLRLLHKEGDDVAATFTHCKQLSALISCSGLESSPPLREMQMEVFQLGVILQPSSSEALCHLGNGQLKQYEASEDDVWLNDAELSFRASIKMEGKENSPSLIPGRLKEQAWWKNAQASAKKDETAAAAAAAASPVSKSQSTTASTVKGTRIVQRSNTGSRSTTGQRSSTSSVITTTTTTTTITTTTAGASRHSSSLRSASSTASKGKAAPPSSKGSAGAVRKPAAGSKPASAGTTSQKSATATNVARKSSTTTAAATKTSGKSVVTLGELKAGTSSEKGKEAAKTTPAGPSSSSSSSGKPSSPETKDSTKEVDTASKKTALPVEVNKSSYLPRLGLARTLAKTKDAKKHEESHKLYRTVMKMSPGFHDAYIELGELLAKSKPKEAVEVYSQFPFSHPPTFDDAYLHGEIIRLIMKSEDYANPCLTSSMIAMGQALGIGVLDKQVALLEGKFKYAILKQVYAGVHNKSVEDPELQAFFKFKCWL